MNGDAREAAFSLRSEVEHTQPLRSVADKVGVRSHFRDGG